MPPNLQPNSDPHLSASARKLRDMSIHIAGLEATRQEYLVLLNYLINQHSGKFIIKKSDLPEQILPVRTEIENSPVDGVQVVMTIIKPELPPLIVS